MVELSAGALRQLIKAELRAAKAVEGRAAKAVHLDRAAAFATAREKLMRSSGPGFVQETERVS